MEAAAAAASVDSGEGEVRRVNLIYFLSRGDGRVEHPHLLRIHRFRRDRVRLRDVKRWLGEVRGKEMPDSFSWSYKRRYRGGYIWQDLLEDDLITPVAGDEYVLKGSQLLSISSSTPKSGVSRVDRKPLPEIHGEFLCREMDVVLKEEEDKRGAYFVDGCGNNNKKKKARGRMLLTVLGCNSAPRTSEPAAGTGCGGNRWRKAAAKQETAAVATCSQCGKPFEPQKLHSHMKSCKGIARRRRR